MEHFVESVTRIPLTITFHWFPFAMFLIMLFSMAGLIGRGMGLRNIFHDFPQLGQLNTEAEIDEHSIRLKGTFLPLLFSAPFLSQIWLTIYMALYWGFAYTLGLTETASDHNLSKMGPIVGPQIVVTAVLSVAFACLTFSKDDDRTSPAAIVFSVLGVAVGIVIAWVLIKMAIVIAPFLDVLLKSMGLSGAATFALAIPGVIVMTITLSLRKMNTAVALISLFTLILIAYGCITQVPDQTQPWVIIGLVMFLVCMNAVFLKMSKDGPGLKFQIPGIFDKDGKSHYEPGRAVDLSKFYGKDEVEYGGSGVTDAESRNPGAARPDADAEDDTGLDPIAQLEAWRRHAEPDPNKKPKMVLLACSGGAYRAGFWTSLILDALTKREREDNENMNGFSRSVRMITGASGGMVGASYFAAMAQPDGSPTPEITPLMVVDIVASQKEGGVVLENGEAYDPVPDYPYKRRYPGYHDSLSPVAQQLIQRDIPGLFSVATQKIDRGTVLEDQWARLDKSFHEMREGEKAGWRPSLVFSPMLAETGQPLLISNLDMSEIRVDPENVETVQFFNWFRHARKSFKVKTAVRLNAAFPYIAPSAALPTNPYRRVVDAGYYDNYGIDLAVSFLSMPRIRDWILENCAGVLIVQTRAFPYPQPSVAEPSNFARAFQWLTTPIEAMLAARGSTMTFRNRQSLRQVVDLYDEMCEQKGGARPEHSFLAIARFEVATKTSMSWYLPGREMEEMGWATVRSPGNLKAFNEVERFWYYH